MDDELTKKIKEIVRKEIPDILRGSAFTARKVTDTPTDSFSVINRKYVTNNGSVASRPISSVAVLGQFFLATDTNTPMWYSPAGWRNGIGSIVAI
ncbi:MAG: hypothetical protein A3F67_10995 [Verrucomicrobia bacterium RIFCSPHIGHO2_12_FULL_41_10]|nr:MAG: hypothetical protein A3F67_10995 [Verrucomicrobia bacterium RIFCSPHIGHO2_12_FULL_41_10]